MTPEEQIAALKQETADLKQAVKRLEKAVDEREAENAKARERIRALEAEKAELAEKLPPDDAVILTGDDAQAWAAYGELGKPDLIRVKLEDYDRATGEAAALKREALVDKAARDPDNETQYRFKPTVLQTLLAATDAQLAKTDKGFAVRVGEAEKSLEKWLEEDQADFLPAVTVKPAGTPAVRQAGPRTNTVTPTVEDAARAKKASGDYYA